MKIGIDCRLWNETGVGRYIRNLVLNLQELDKKNDYVLLVLNKDYENVKCQISNVKWKIIKADIRWHTFEEQLRLPQILNKENLDLVHFPYFSMPIFYNRPFVVTIHDLIINHFSTGQASTLPMPIYNLKLLAYKFVLNQVVRKARKIIAVSNATKNEIIDHLKINPQKISVTYEGISQKLAVSSQKLMVKGKYFLYVGNAFPHKNLDRLLEAFRILNSNVRLVFVGKEDYFYKSLKNKVQLMKFSNKAIFLQNVSDEELANLYQNALALILPSLMEGFGLPALEAMANNCLVLASNIPALKEICADAAIYFNPLSVDELVDKLNMVTSHTTEYGGLENLKKKGAERIKLFSWEKMAKETLKIYSSLAL